MKTHIAVRFLAGTPVSACGRYVASESVDQDRPSCRSCAGWARRQDRWAAEAVSATSWTGSKVRFGQGGTVMHSILIAVVLAGLALAAPAAHAGLAAFSGALELSFGTETGAILPGAGAVSTSLLQPALRSVGAPLNAPTSVPVPADAFTAIQVELPVTDPFAYPLAGVMLSGRNQAGGFAGSPLLGQLPLEGVVRLCLFGSCRAPLLNLEFPLSVIGNHAAVTERAFGIGMTVVGAPWTTGTAAVGTVSRQGGVSTSGANLVTPIAVSTNLPATPLLPGFGALRVLFE